MQELLSTLPLPMQPNITLPIIIGIFLVLIFVLNKMIFKPLVEVLDERARRIKEGADAKENALRTVEESQQKYQKALIAARQEAGARKQAMLKEVDKVREEVVDKAREEATAMREKVSTELTKTVAESRAALEKDTRAIAQGIAARILSRAS